MLDLFTIIWGEEMVASYLDVVLPSLMQPDNIPGANTLLGNYTLYASDDARAAISENERFKALPSWIDIVWVSLQKGEWETTSNTAHQMRRSAKAGNHMLILTPDTAIGNGSIANIAKLCREGYNPILFGFPRVTEDGYQAMKKRYSTGDIISNRQMVSMAMNHVEQVTYAMENRESRGIVHNNTWVVRHNVPTPCIKPDKFIIRLFGTNPTVNSGFDHILPYILVEAGYPWHLIRHSDIYFQAERGRHLISEGSGHDTQNWDTYKQIRSLEFFNKEEVIWQGT